MNPTLQNIGRNMKDFRVQISVTISKSPKREKIMNNRGPKTVRYLEEKRQEKNNFLAWDYFSACNPEALPSSCNLASVVMETIELVKINFPTFPFPPLPCS